MIRKGLFLALAISTLTFTSCKKEEGASSKINPENVAAAADRDATASNFPVMTFNKAEHDFGTINEGDQVETKFSYTNTGAAPLVVVSMKGSCGCTVPNDWSKEPLAPGDTAEFTVKFDSKNKPNQQQKSVTITANTEAGREVVKIKAMVTPDPNKPAQVAPTNAPAPVLQTK